MNEHEQTSQEPNHERVAEALETIVQVFVGEDLESLRHSVQTSESELFRRIDALREESTTRLDDSTGDLAGRIESLSADLSAAEKSHGEALAGLEDRTDREVIEYLTAFRGVGVKTAACVLCFAMGRSYMPVDTHVHRVARRLGLIGPRATADQAHELLNRDSSVPPELRFSFHIQLIRHGRAVCRAGRPACDTCVLGGLCPRIGI